MAVMVEDLTADFAIGDVIRLKSGEGPKMVVNGVNPHQQSVVGVWFSQMGTFQTTQLDVRIVRHEQADRS